MAGSIWWAAAAALGLGAVVGGCADTGGSRVAVSYNAAWGEPYWGWYGDYYYPGTGVYVYDRNRNRTLWTPQQRGYWEARRSGWRGDRHLGSNWNDFKRRR
jgi:hypothetical protein